MFAEVVSILHIGQPVTALNENKYLPPEIKMQKSNIINLMIQYNDN